MTSWLVREASFSDWPDIKQFFKTLDGESRYLYFGGHVSDEIVDRTWERFEGRNNDKFFLVEVLGSIVGVCQVAQFDSHAELSVAVAREYRQRGIGHTLIERAVTWCKTHDIKDIMMFCLPNNNVVQRIIQRHKLLPVMLSTPAEAKFIVPQGSVVDHQKEWWHQLISRWITFFRRPWTIFYS